MGRRNVTGRAVYLRDQLRQTFGPFLFAQARDAAIEVCPQGDVRLLVGRRYFTETDNGGIAVDVPDDRSFALWARIDEHGELHEVDELRMAA